MADLSDTVFLVDADNTLLDNDRVLSDLRHYFTRELGVESRERYIEILRQLWDELGYRDYLGALQRYRIQHPYDLHIVRVSSWLIDYPFDKRLYPNALEVIARLRHDARTVIVTDGDVVFQPRKLERSGLWSAVSGHALIYIHKEKELGDIERRYPARHYVLVDDKPRLLTAFKEQWGDRVTTVFPRQGQYARERGAFGEGPRPDVTIRRIGDLLGIPPEDLVGAAPASAQGSRSPAS